MSRIYVHNMILEKLSSTKTECESIDPKELWCGFTKKNRRHQIKYLILNHNKI